jgi:hypothetical protein
MPSQSVSSLQSVSSIQQQKQKQQVKQQKQQQVKKQKKQKQTNFREADINVQKQELQKDMIDFFNLLKNNLTTSGNTAYPMDKKKYEFINLVDKTEEILKKLVTNNLLRIKNNVF